MRTVLAYTDGSAVVRGPCKGNGDFYGKRRAFSLGFKETKTGRMEIMALLYAITAFHINRKEAILLRVYSDSEYVVKSFTEKRLEKWIQAGWRNTSGVVKNIDLWKAIIDALNKRPFLELEMRHIKSHQVEKEKCPIAKKRLMSNPHIIGNMMADFYADYKRHKVLLETDKL